MSIVEMKNYSQKTVDFHYYHFPLSYHLTSHLFISVVDAFGTKQRGTSCFIIGHIMLTGLECCWIIGRKGNLWTISEQMKNVIGIGYVHSGT